MFRVFHSRFVSVAVAAIVLSLFGLGSSAVNAASPGRKAVFVMTNSLAGNAVLAFSRAADGSLAAAGSFPTGGLGAAALGSQGALTLSDDGRWLFAVNGGSNDLSVLDAAGDDLAVTSRVPSGGVKPNSVTARNNLVYVLNSGTPANISGFTLDPHGQLTPIAGSTQPLSNANPGGAQIQFSPDGHWLVVTEKATQMIDTYAVDADGVAGPPVASPSNGAVPFGFGIDNRGHVVVSEAGAGAVSSYAIAPDGTLVTISPSVVAAGQNAACWIAITKNGRYAYAANAASGTLTGYAIAPDGSLSIVSGNAVTAAPGGTPLDMAFSEDSQYLYVFNRATAAVDTFAVQADGGLVALGAMGGFPAGSTGIAAR